jgi:hypothetical protein
MTEVSQSRILELLREDDHSLSELASAVGIKVPTDPQLMFFAQVIASLLRSNEIQTLQKNKSTGLLEPIDYRDSRLAHELSAIDRPNPDTGYWFRSIK